MSRRIPRCALGPCLIILTLCAAAPAGAGEDPRVTPWVQALFRGGRGPGGEALYHALAANLSRLPPAGLRAALKAPALRPTDPFTAAARDQILATLDRDAGDLERAGERIRRHGFLLQWEIVLPERLAGVTLSADPASGWVSPADYARFSGVEPVVLETRLEVRGDGHLLFLAAGDGVAALRVREAELRPPLQEASLLDQTAFCPALPEGPTVLRLELHPDRAARSFAVRLARPDGRPLPDPTRAAAGPGACIPGPLEAWEGRLSDPRERATNGGTGKAPPQEDTVAGLWLLTRVGRITRPRDTLLDALHPTTWLELDLLAEVLSGQRQCWESICARVPLCAGGWPAEVLRGEGESRRGQSYRPLRRLRDLADRIPADASAGPDAGWIEREQLLRADLLHGLGLVYGARRVLEVPGDDPTPDLLDAWVNLQVSGGAREAAIGLLLPEHRRRPGGQAVGSLLATLLTDAGRLGEALGVWETLARHHPLDPDLPLEISLGLAHLGRLEEALALLDTLAARVGANTRLWEERGRILARVGRTEEAAAAWRRGLELEPQNPDLQALLRRVAPGGRLWPTLRRSLAWALNQTGGEDENGHAAEGLVDLRLITIHPNGLYTIHRQQILRIIDPGTDGELNLSAVYDPHTEELTTLTAAVLRHSGEVLQASDGDDLSLSQEEFNLHYDLRERVRYFPRLEAGDVVVWETRLDQFRGARSGVSLVRILQEGIPKRLVEIAVSMPRNLELQGLVKLAGDNPRPPAGADPGGRWGAGPVAPRGSAGGHPQALPAPGHRAQRPHGPQHNARLAAGGGVVRESPGAADC